ncbi:MAG: phosphohistidine phosphatase SixA [Acidobacteria bacterium]|nr:MAG: phosphohistidine phosphatase SixA [Acidobacteriota bacterium]
MRIYLLRHGIAEPQSESNDFSDANRALTPAGITKLKQAGLGLTKLGVRLELVASSPLVRARETAENVTAILKCKEPIQLWDELAPGGSLDGLMQKLQRHQDKDSVLLVGHQPDMGFLASFLVFGSNQISLAFKKGAICCVQVNEVPPQFPGELLWMLTPKILKKLGGK